MSRNNSVSSTTTTSSTSVSKNVKKETELDNHPLVVEIVRIMNEIDKFKDKVHPEDVNTKKVYHKKAPTRSDFISLRSSLKQLIKDVKTAIKRKNKKEQKDKKEVKPGAGFLRMVQLKPQLAAFIGTEKKGLGNIYSDALLTSYFTDYFYTMGCKEGPYVIPNKPLIDLFRPKLKEWGVIDDHDQLITQVDIRKNGNKQSYKGFKFIHLQRLLKDLIVTNPVTGKRVVVPQDGNENVLNILAKERKHLDEIKSLRKQLDDIKSKLSKRLRMSDKAKELGDQVAFDREVKEIENEKRRKEKDLRYACEDCKFPFSL